MIEYESESCLQNCYNVVQTAVLYINDLFSALNVKNIILYENQNKEQLITFQVLAMGVAYRLRDCPRNEKEWQKASNSLNCTSDVNCLHADNLTTLLEFCYNRMRITVGKGTLALISTKYSK